MTLAEVKIVEVGPRDGLQNIDKHLPTALKVELIQRLHCSGLQNVEITSVVSPSAVPQLQDCRQVLRSEPVVNLLSTGRGHYPVLTPNIKGVQIAHQHGASEVAVFVSAAEGFSKANAKCTVAQGIIRARESASEAKRLGMAVRGYVSCIFTDPFDGPTAPSAVLHAVKALMAMGCYEISLGDTLGTGSPSQVRRLITNLKENHVPVKQLAGHFHDTYGQALANVWEAYQCGIRTFDGSVAGLGGCPFAPGAKGNAATEDLVYMFQQAGISTGGVELDKLVDVGQWISSQLSQANGSRAGSAVSFKKNMKTTAARPQASTNADPVRSSWTVVKETECLIVERNGANLKIVMNLPQKGNMLTTPMILGLTKAMTAASEDPTIGRVAIVGSGKFFCTGMDLGKTGASVGEMGAAPDDAPFSRLKKVFEVIDKSPKVTIACINGPAFGGGVGLALACDIRLSARNATLTLSEAKLGLCPALISKYVIRELGACWAREAMLSGRTIEAEELKARGVVYHVASETEDIAHALDSLLKELRPVSSEASRMCKDLVRSGRSEAQTTEQDAAIERLFKEMMRKDGPGRHGISEFQARRKVDWDMYLVQKHGTSKL